MMKVHFKFIKGILGLFWNVEMAFVFLFLDLDSQNYVWGQGLSFDIVVWIVIAWGGVKG